MRDAHHQDLNLVTQVINGHESAADQLVERLSPLVASIVRRRQPRRSDEADMSQTVFLKIFSHLDQYSGQVPLEHWVSRIAVNACLNELRYERNRPELRHADLSPDHEELLANLAQPGNEIDPSHQTAARELIDQLLATLPPREHMLISMLHFESLSTEDIHRTTGWSRLAIRLLAFRARKRLKNQLKKLLSTRKPQP